MTHVAYGGIRNHSLTDRIQMAIGALALGAVLLSVLPFGGVLPVVWTLLAAFVLVLFLAQLAIDLLLDPPGAAARRAVGPAALYALALLWGPPRVRPSCGLRGRGPCGSS